MLAGRSMSSTRDSQRLASKIPKDAPSAVSANSREVTVDVTVGCDGQIVVSDELKLPKMFLSQKSYKHSRTVELQRSPPFYNVILDKCRPGALYIGLAVYLIFGGSALYLCESLIYCSISKICSSISTIFNYFLPF